MSRQRVTELFERRHESARLLFVVEARKSAPLTVHQTGLLGYYVERGSIGMRCALDEAL